MTFDRRYFTLGDLMPLDGFIKKQSYLSQQASLVYCFIDFAKKLS